MPTQYEKLTDYAKRMGMTYQGVWLWYRDGKIPGAKKINGAIFVPLEEQSSMDDSAAAAIYSRVSSSQNKDNLDSQAQRLIEYCTAKGYQIKSVTKEIGSGLNDNRKKLHKLLDDESWNVLVVEHKDRLTRFGFSYLEHMVKNQGRTIEVVNVSDEASDVSDIMEDLVSIVTSFCARIYGRRRASRKTEKMISAMKDSGDE